MNIIIYSASENILIYLILRPTFSAPYDLSNLSGISTCFIRWHQKVWSEIKYCRYFGGPLFLLRICCNFVSNTFLELKEHYRSTPLNASAFGVTLDSSLKSRPGQQTKATSPGRLQFGVIICYNKIKRKVTVQCSARNGGSWFGLDNRPRVRQFVRGRKWWGGVRDGWKYGWRCLTVRSSRFRLIKF